MNEVKLQGQITSDPEVKESRNGILRGSFLLTTKREFDSYLQFSTNQIAQNVDYINAFEFFYCQIR